MEGGVGCGGKGFRVCRGLGRRGVFVLGRDFGGGCGHPM